MTYEEILRRLLPSRRRHQPDGEYATAENQFDTPGRRAARRLKADLRLAGEEPAP